MAKRKKKIAILIEDLYEDLEFWYPLLRLREAGAHVVVVGPQTKTYFSKHNYQVKADISVDQVKAVEFDAIIIPGGYAPDRIRRNKAMVALVRNAFQKGKIIAAICHAGWVLISADVVRGRRITGYMSIKDDLINAGGLYEDKEVVCDGNLITSRVPEDLPSFCKTIIKKLGYSPT
ncbi:MAG: type 1 glutamine amidotransferase [Proteobacteria bacterium]|nr:type 1 glutamine amidotransferase [Pseudomonadota bacterium]